MTGMSHEREIPRSASIINPGSLLRGAKTREHIEYVTRSRLRVARLRRVVFSLCFGPLSKFAHLPRESFASALSLSRGDKNRGCDNRSASPDGRPERYVCSIGRRRDTAYRRTRTDKLNRPTRRAVLEGQISRACVVAQTLADAVTPIIYNIYIFRCNGRCR